MRSVKKWFQARAMDRAMKATQWVPATGERLRKNVKKYSSEWLNDSKKHLTNGLHSEPPKHPGDLFYILDQISQHALELGMLDWRAGIDPSPRLIEIKSSFDVALDVRPDISPTYRNPGFTAITFDMMGWDWPYNTNPPGKDDIKFPVYWMDRWITAGLANPSCWSMKEGIPAVKNQFVQKSLDDYWALLTDQIEPEEGMQRCIKNYDRRATHTTFKAISSYFGGGDYNELFIDYTLAAILKKRGLVSDSVHDWVWG